MSSTITFKVIVDKRHIGPVKSRSQRFDELSKAAGKIAFNNDIKLVRKIPVSGTSSVDATVNPVASQVNGANIATSTNTQVVTKTHSLDAEGLKAAMLIANYMENVAQNSDAYTKKMSAFESKRNEVMSAFGLPVGPEANKNPLTASQRELYNSQMAEFAFDYLDIRIHIKVGDDKTVQTKHIRQINGSAAAFWNTVLNYARQMAPKCDVVKRITASNGGGSGSQT